MVGRAAGALAVATACGIGTFCRIVRAVLVVRSVGQHRVEVVPAVVGVPVTRPLAARDSPAGKAFPLLEVTVTVSELVAPPNVKVTGVSAVPTVPVTWEGEVVEGRGSGSPEVRRYLEILTVLSGIVKLRLLNIGRIPLSGVDPLSTRSSLFQVSASATGKLELYIFNNGDVDVLGAVKEPF